MRAASAVRWTNLLKTLRGQRRSLNERSWSLALERSRYAQALPSSDRRRLRETMVAFLNAKHIEGAAGFEATHEAQAIIALKACVPILNLGLDNYSGWSDIVIYPGDFRVNDEYMDDTGVVHRETRDLCGQSLTQGPMVLSWEAIEEERALPDRDVVIHECAHKLDILNGPADGFPPLPSNMPVPEWTRTFRSAFDDFCSTVDAGVDTRLDPYGAFDPAEFFAVLSETYFTEPAIVYLDFPAVYQKLAQFYRQDPYALLEQRA